MRSNTSSSVQHLIDQLKNHIKNYKHTYRKARFDSPYDENIFNLYWELLDKYATEKAHSEDKELAENALLLYWKDFNNQLLAKNGAKEKEVDFTQLTLDQQHDIINDYSDFFESQFAMDRRNDRSIYTHAGCMQWNLGTLYSLISYEKSISKASRVDRLEKAIECCEEAALHYWDNPTETKTIKEALRVLRERLHKQCEKKEKNAKPNRRKRLHDPSSRNQKDEPSAKRYKPDLQLLTSNGEMLSEQDDRSTEKSSVQQKKNSNINTVSPDRFFAPMTPVSRTESEEEEENQSDHAEEKIVHKGNQENRVRKFI